MLSPIGHWDPNLEDMSSFKLSTVSPAEDSNGLQQQGSEFSALAVPAPHLAASLSLNVPSLHVLAVNHGNSSSAAFSYGTMTTSTTSSSSSGDVTSTASAKKSKSSSSSSNSGGTNTTATTTNNNKNNQVANSLLHRSCAQFATNRFVIKTALDLDPSAARREATICASPQKTELAEIRNRFVALPQQQQQRSRCFGCRRSNNDTNNRQSWTTTAPRRSSKEAFSYPLNIALNNDASRDVLALLVCAAPDVATQTDGSNKLCSLSLALIKRPQDASTLDMLLTANPRAVVIPDQRRNLPLHVAVQHNAPLQVVRQIHCLFPDATRMENFHGETPLMIAQRNSKCSEEVLNFLQSRTYE